MAATKKNSKWIHAAMLALVGIGTDLGAQLTAGQLNVTRSVIVGLVIGGAARLGGAILSAMVVANEEDEGGDA